MINLQILRRIDAILKRFCENNIPLTRLLSCIPHPGSYTLPIQRTSILNSSLLVTGSRDITTPLSIPVHLSAVL